MLRWKIAIQEYRINITIIFKEYKRYTNADGPSRWKPDIVEISLDYDPEVAANNPIYFMKICRKRNFKFSNGHQEVGPQIQITLDQKRQKSPY
ncbi:hypothetical protein O181_024928 [Austropuccinia psidii MF-1]|uniref:Uncharacterized protein n=1 Tax=Austropuccinia psidii MF-1 TaxID=1389203 RepID=A0A9Q3GYM7_9BASI|nr:hypothetical protein [Austropuccinia psidii MF-1]